ncbi:l-ascorbate oxidase-like protein [Hordeum vulgare]|nr:l-ascorbate oxidase-like protein [Hordeum vulgare]
MPPMSEGTRWSSFSNCDGPSGLVSDSLVSSPRQWKERGATLWLRMHGCGNGVVPVVAERTRPQTVFLSRGWKSFARAHSLWDRHVLCFKKVAENTLFVKLYRSSGARLGCCEESSSGIESLSSCENSEERTDDDDSGSGSGSLQ